MPDFPLNNLTSEIIGYENLPNSFDYVVSHLKCKGQREYVKPKREMFIAQLADEIGSGRFRIEREEVKDITVTDGPKIREVQAPPVYKRIGCNSIMVVVEKYVYQAVIRNTAASIKGRGMHWLHHIVEEDMRNAPNLWQYYYQNDVRHFYDTIDQEQMKRVIREYVADEVLLPILDNFITLMPKGLSKGLRSSQCFANLYLSPVHHKLLKEAERYTLVHDDGSMEDRPLYYNYCDDTVIAGRSKKELWRLRDIYVEEIGKLGLEIKHSEAMRPLSEGLDFLGYKNYGSHSIIRKRTKQNAARKLHRVKSRRRRLEIIGSFKGMAVHADCKHLFNKLTGQHMRKFGELGIVYKPADGKKRFTGKQITLGALANRPIEVHDYEQDVSTKHGDGRYLVSVRTIDTGEWCKFFTACEEMKAELDLAREMADGIPFETVIRQECFEGGKRMFHFT